MLDYILFGLMGFLLLNGLPHFLAGAAAVKFRLFARAAAPAQANFVWGMVNFLAATILLTWRLSTAGIGKGHVVALLVGAWLAILMFGLGAKWFYAAQLAPPATPESDTVEQ